jgi:hypothetical protein
MQIAAIPDRLSTVQRVTICFTVEGDCAALLRRAIVAACRESVELLRTQKVPRSTQVRIWFVLAATAASDAMLAVMRTVPRGEIGPVLQQQQDLERRRQ